MIRPISPPGPISGLTPEPFAANGKQVLFDGQHWGDMATERAAEFTAAVLNSRCRLLGRVRFSDFKRCD